jgi:hypothetical protein
MMVRPALRPDKLFCARLVSCPSILRIIPAPPWHNSSSTRSGRPSPHGGRPDDALSDLPVHLGGERLCQPAHAWGGSTTASA